VLYYIPFTKLNYQVSRSNQITNIVNNTVDHFRLMVLEEQYPFRIGDHVRYRDIHGVIRSFSRMVNGKIVFSLYPCYSAMMKGEDVFADIIRATSATPNNGGTIRINIKQLLKSSLSYSQVCSLYLLPENDNPLLNTAISLYNQSLGLTV